MRVRFALAGLQIVAAALPAQAISPNSLSFSAVSAGARHTCALTTTERVYCWGDNAEGELGNGTRVDSPAPVAVAGNVRFLSIDAGVEFTCGVATTGEAYCWGRNTTGALGNAAPQRSTVPALVTGGVLFRSVASGADHACGIDSDGAAYCWGDNSQGQLGTLDTTSSARPVPVAGNLRFRALTAGDAHTCGLADDSLAYCWGGNRRGQLGIGSRGTYRGPQPVAYGRHWSTISAGAVHTCGVTADRHPELFCWGDNFHQQITDGRVVITQIPTVAARDNVPRQAGDWGAVAILYVPTFVSQPVDLVAVTSGRWHTCISRRQDARAVVCWGDNMDDQLGWNVWGPYVQVSAGDAHTCALRRDGAIYCWGRNTAGQLGNGTLYREARPVRVNDPVALGP